MAPEGQLVTTIFYPELVPLALLLATVPIWIGAIDVSDVGPPPVV